MPKRYLATRIERGRGGHHVHQPPRRMAVRVLELQPSVVAPGLVGSVAALADDALAPDFTGPVSFSTGQDIRGRFRVTPGNRLSEQMMRARFAELGAAALIGSPADLGKLVDDDTEKWAGIVRAANIRPE